MSSIPALNSNYTNPNVTDPGATPPGDPRQAFFAGAFESIRANLPSYEQMNNCGATLALPALAIAGGIGSYHFLKHAKINSAKDLKDIENQHINSRVVNIQRALGVTSGLISAAAAVTAIAKQLQYA